MKHKGFGIGLDQLERIIWWLGSPKIQCIIVTKKLSLLKTQRNWSPKRTNLSIVGWRAEKSKANVPINNFLLKKQFKQSWQVLTVNKNFLHFPLYASLLTAC